MPLVALHAVKPAAVHGNHGALHINQIVLAQMLSFLTIKDCATLCVFLQDSYGMFHLGREGSIVIACQ
jgi:hypothetical protein